MRYVAPMPMERRGSPSGVAPVLLGRRRELYRRRDPTAERIDDAALERDWHSDYAVFILRLADRLQATTDPAKREQLIARLGAALDE
jgi:hypothetical protein